MINIHDFNCSVSRLPGKLRNKILKLTWFCCLLLKLAQFSRILLLLKYFNDSQIYKKMETLT